MPSKQLPFNTATFKQEIGTLSGQCLPFKKIITSSLLLIITTLNSQVKSISYLNFPSSARSASHRGVSRYCWAPDIDLFFPWGGEKLVFNFTLWGKYHTFHKVAGLFLLSADLGYFVLLNSWAGLVVMCISNCSYTCTFKASFYSSRTYFMSPMKIIV